MNLCDRNDILEWLTDNLPPKRVQHIFRVETMAQELAKAHQLELQIVSQGALLHDVAKCYPPQRLLSIAQRNFTELHPIELQNPHLLHGPVGALEAKRIFGTENSQVLQAIHNHTLGQPGMDDVSCIVFLADSLEPGRGETDKLNRLRKTCYKSLAKAVAGTCDYQIKKLIKRNLPIHPRMVDTRNWAIAQDHRKGDKLNN